MADLLAAPRRGRKRAAITAVVTLILLGGGIAAYASTTSDGARYRTAVAGPAEIDQTVEAVGTAVPADSKAYAFSTSGTVSTVDVKAGQQVTPGQALASLDQTSLNNALAQAQLVLANAQLALENDKTGKGSSNSSSNSSANSSGNSRSNANASSQPPTSNGPSSADIAAAQKAVTTAQHLVDTDLAAQQPLLDSATATCADSSKTPADCQTAQQAVLTAQGKTSTDEAALLATEQQLTTLLNQLASSTSSSSSGQTTPTTNVASAAQLAADQAVIDAAAAQVAVTQENLGRASLLASGAGTVLSVGLIVGTSVTANSTTSTVVIANATDFAFTITVPVTALNSLKVGDTAVVTPDGTSDKLSGKVTTVGIAPTTSGGSSYAVTISLDKQPTGLRSGMNATVTISTDTVSSAVSVPSTALTRSDATYSVKTLVGSKVTTKTVQVGVSGETLTQITSGLAAGDVVVLADRHAKIPTGTTNNQLRGLTGTGGAVTNGGFAGGGFTGGAAGGLGGRN